MEMELKVALVRTFDIAPAYAEWDACVSEGRDRIRTVDGNRAYRTLVGRTHPADGFPVRVRVRAERDIASSVHF